MVSTNKYGLVGHPLGHSFSRKFHNERFAQLGIDAVYDNFDIESINMLPEILKVNSDIRGLNVTIPYKQEIMAYLDELDPRAEKIGAVNVVKATPTNRTDTKVSGWYLKGFNSDIIGFRDSLLPMLPPAEERAGKGALVLGTGGASKAIFVALQELGYTPVYVSRTAAPGRLTYQDLTADIMAKHPVIVNCTPLGMHPKVDACPDIPYELLSQQHVCFDCVYNPDVTLFMKKASEYGAQVKCGYEMLVGQAIESYRLWTE